MGLCMEDQQISSIKAGNCLGFVSAFMNAALSGHSGETCTYYYTYKYNVFPKIARCLGCPAALFAAGEEIEELPLFQGCLLAELRERTAISPKVDPLTRNLVTALFAQVLESGHIRKKCAAGFISADFGFGSAEDVQQPDLPQSDLPSLP